MQYPNQFGIQTNGLDGRPRCPKAPPLPHWSYIQSNSNSTLTGFQTNAPANLYNGCSPPDSVLLQTVNNAISHETHFLEIYQSDILDPALLWVVSYAHQQLAQCAAASVTSNGVAPLAVEAYPNPFRRLTTIRYTLPRASHVDLTVYGLCGQRVATLVHGEESDGNHEAPFVGTHLAIGLYFYRLQVGVHAQTHKLLLIR